MKLQLTDRFQHALQQAYQLHHGHFRKESGIPYLAHLLSVSALVMENGGDEDQAIAALLHDAVEDQGGLDTLNLIKDQFGDEVARIVEGCTDAYTNPKPDWEPRKEAYFIKLRQADEKILLVSLADKVHNARSIRLDLLASGEQAWEKFNGKRSGSIKYYQTLVEIFERSPYDPLKQELRSLVAEFETYDRGQEARNR